MSLPAKPCVFCGTEFVKPPTCGKPAWGRRKFCSPACKKLSQKGQPNPNKGKEFPKTAPRHPCRICGEPTQYLASKERLAGLVHCGSERCRDESRRLKNERIGAVHAEGFASGRRIRLNGWAHVSRVSKEEDSITPWFESIGWVAQHRVLLGVHTNKLPRQASLDFALPESKLFVEIDGTSHRDRAERDARRDALLAAIGWRGLRISASLVREDIETAKSQVTSWLHLN